MKFSIITITHNRAHLIDKTISSVLNQTYQNFEHIIIDDGSTDATKDVINSFNNKKIKYYFYEKNKHRSFLRNEGIRKANGEIICILDSDDIWVRTKLQELVDVFNSSKGILFVFHNFHLDNGSKAYIFKTDFFKNVLIDILDNRILPYPFYSFKQSVLQKISLYDETMIDGQHDFFLRAAAKYKFYYNSKKLASKINHDTNLSKKPRVSALTNYLVTIEKLYNNGTISKKEYRKYSSRVNLKIAKFFIDKNESSKAVDFLNKASKIAPRCSILYFKTLALKQNQKVKK